MPDKSGFSWCLSLALSRRVRGDVFSRGSLRQGAEKSTGRVNAGRINFFIRSGPAKKMNTSPVDFTAAPAADVFPRKAPHPGERRTQNRQREKHQKEARGFKGE
ncbi:hypothetical protein HVC08_002308 [Salmonella enterica]|nr:hypothetical protein [Salmonella enterica]